MLDDRETWFEAAEKTKAPKSKFGFCVGSLALTQLASTDLVADLAALGLCKASL